MAEGFIKLHRKLLEWEWFDDANTLKLFIYCLCRANWEEGSWHGITYHPGEFITSLPKLSESTKLSLQEVRTALKHLKSTGEITDKGYNKFRIITVNNWDLYQGDNRQTNRQLTDNQQTTNRQLTADKEIKEIKEKKKRAFSDFNQRKYDFSELTKEANDG